MTNTRWAREDHVSDEELAELRHEIAATMDDHEQTRPTDWRQRLLLQKSRPRTDSVVRRRMRKLRTNDAADSMKTQPSIEAETSPVRRATCDSCNTAHRGSFTPARFDTVEHSLSAIHDLACYLDKSPRTIWLALEGIFTARQTTSAPNLYRHRVTILARVLPTAVALLLVAFSMLHFLMTNHQTDSGYTPLFSELGFLLSVMLFSTITFFCLAAVMLMIKSSRQERFLNGFSRLVNWSIPIILSFFMASPEFLLLLQDLAGGSSANVSGIETILATHHGIVETIYWTVLVYVALYTGNFFLFVAFSKVFQEQHEYVHRHEVLRDMIPILVADATQPQRRKLFRVYPLTRD
ncbi:hypothetical protein GCM10009720_10210 [Yaniella flava]|uniref:Uncharacterized protein n=1 Tax=Yaniella flava TaxID=287930 RepID=A0ABN2U9S5_9MICC|nr:hypothetical protein [Micrococcaceae bacterium]